VTDVTNASRTQLLNLLTLDWDEKLLAAFDISLRGAAKGGFKQRSLWRSEAKGSRGRSDHGNPRRSAGGIVGQACFRPGEVKNTYGTGCFLLMNTV